MNEEQKQEGGGSRPWKIHCQEREASIWFALGWESFEAQSLSGRYPQGRQGVTTRQELAASPSGNSELRG